MMLSVHHYSIFVRCRVDSSSLTCISEAFDGNVTVNMTAGGPVRVFIDNANISMDGVEFEFRGDPVYTAVTPQKVIPA